MKRSVSVRVSKWAQIIFIWAIAVVFFAPLCLAVPTLSNPAVKSWPRRYRSPRAFILTIIAL